MVSFGNESKIAISSAVHDFACVNSIGLNFSLFASLNQINSMSLQFKEEKKRNTRKPAIVYSCLQSELYLLFEVVWIKSFYFPFKKDT